MKTYPAQIGIFDAAMGVLGLVHGVFRTDRGGIINPQSSGPVQWSRGAGERRARDLLVVEDHQARRAGHGGLSAAVATESITNPTEDV